MLKYTYKIQNDGGGHGERIYIQFAFNRQIGKDCVYRHGILREKATQLQRDIMDSIAETTGVIKSNDDISPELININGNSILVRINKLDDFPSLASKLIKKIQRRIAPNESRKRITYQKLQENIKELNNKTWGVE